eukprot:5744070-Prymnesium_polylepis.1
MMMVVIGEGRPHRVRVGQVVSHQAAHNHEHVHAPWALETTHARVTYADGSCHIWITGGGRPA